MVIHFLQEVKPPVLPRWNPTEVRVMQSKLLFLDSLAMKRLSITDSSLSPKIETTIRF